MSKRRIFDFKPQPRLKWRGQDGQHETEQPDHSASLGDSITSATRTRFSVHTGVYSVAVARDQAEYDGATDELFGSLDECENRLADGRRFLLGDQLTLADMLMFTPLVRFDAVYNPLFRASRKRLVDYPGLTSLVKRIYDLPHVAATVRLDHILTHYYDGDWAVATRRGIVPHPHSASWITSPTAARSQ